ncbi:MAG TPA: TetR/AcrR family transcriptional regulator [Acidimicrobiales bacterium]|nr:TetR/AcrR family transcriptional regulator [Acidimicrobiales bacterium]
MGRSSTSNGLESYSERVEEILTTATTLFSELGYRGVGIRRIADAVGVQPSSLYHHVPGKEELLYRIALRATTEFIDAHPPALETDTDVPQTLRSLVRAHVVYFGRNKLAQQVAERELRELSPEHFEEVRRRQRQWLDSLTTLVERGQREGTLRVANPRIATRAMLDMLNHFNRWYESRPGLRLDDLADLYADLVVDGLLQAMPTPSGAGR